MRIAIYGAGGVGGYFGGRLAQSGEDVTFIARGAHLKAMRAAGLRVDSIKENFHIYPAHATDSTAEAGVVDYVLVAVKAWQVPEIAPSIAPLLSAHTTVVPLQNGVEAPQQLASALGLAHVAGGLCKIVSYIAAPGHIVHAGVEPAVSIGELDNRRSERIERLRRAFQNAGVMSDIPPDIHVALWEKFLFISSASGVGAVCRAPIGVIRSIPESRRMVERAMREVCAVAAAKGIPLSPDLTEKAMRYVDGIPFGNTTSMQRDIMEGRPSELEYQNGSVVRFGKELNVPVPVHQFIYDALLPSEKRARGLLQY